MNIHIIMFSENNFSNNKLVTIAKRIHLFPSRTQKLSSLTPTIVDKAKIGHRLEIFFCYKKRLNLIYLVFFYNLIYMCLNC